MGDESLKKEINLLPRNIVIVEFKKRRKFFLSLLVIIILFMLATIYIWLQIKITQLKRDEAKLDSALRQSSFKISIIDDLEKQNEGIKKKLSILDSLDKDRLIWSEVIEEIKGVIPDKLFLTNLNFSPDKELAIRGQSSDSKSIAVFIYLLEKTDCIKNVRLKGVQQNPNALKFEQSHVFSFELTFELNYEDRRK